MVLALSLRFLLESRPIHDLDVPVLDLNKPLCAEAGQIPRDYFSDRSEARRDLLVGHREIEGLGTGSFRSVQQQTRQALRHASESHRFDQTDEMPEPPAHDSQNFQSNLGVLTANLLEVALVDEERDHRFHHPHRGRVWPSIEQGKFGYRCRRRLNGKHDLSPTWRCPEDLHAALNDEEYPSALLSFPEEHFIRGETLLDCPLGKPLKFAFTKGGEQSNF